MTDPKIYLVHAHRVSMDPTVAAFAAQWPQARIANLLEDSLFTDFGRDGRLTEAMVERFRSIGRYCVQSGADAILFTCSAFGPAIEAVKHDQRIPILKPNEALYDEIADINAHGGRVLLLATFPPTILSMMAEIRAHSAARGVVPVVEPRLVEGALDALQAGDAAAHHRQIAQASEAADGFAAVAWGQISMAPARASLTSSGTVPVLTTPDGSIRKLRALL